MLVTAYYRLFRIGEISQSEHVIKACDVHIGTNKKKLMFVVRSSKTHSLGDKPQIVKIKATTCGKECKKKSSTISGFLPV